MSAPPGTRGPASSDEDSLSATAVDPLLLGGSRTEVP